MREQETKRRIVFFVLIILFSIANIKYAIAPVTDYYSTSGSYGGNWTNAATEVDSTPDDIVAWDETDNNKELYTYNFINLPASGTINNIIMSVRSNFSNPGVGDDELALKYSFDGSVWKNLDGTDYDGSDYATQNSDLIRNNYSISASLSWSNLSNIYLGVQGIMFGLPDNEIVGIDSIWLKVNYSDLQGPNIRLMRPMQDNWSLTSSIVFFYNVSDELNSTKNCTLILNNYRNMSNSSISEDSVLNFTLSHIDDNFYNWSINCTDNSEFNNENTSDVRALYVDTTPPLINLISPLNNNEWNLSPIVVLNYNVSDYMTNVTQCILHVDGKVSGPLDSTITEQVTQNFSRTLGNGNHTWSINCTDGNLWIGNSTTFNFSVEVYYPNVTLVQAEQPVILNVGSTTQVICNATVSHPDGASLISNVNATFFDRTLSGAQSGDEDDNTKHYSNSSCTQIGIGALEANYTCAFDVWYYANNASWTCNISAFDNNGQTHSNSDDTTVNELFGISLYPSEINYTSLYAGENSTDNFNITVTNLGNSEMDISLFGYGYQISDELSMNCTIGNISVEREHYSLESGEAYNQMDKLSSSAVQLDTFNLNKKTNETYNSTQIVYWKMGLPLGVSGNCTGYVVFGALAS